RYRVRRSGGTPEHLGADALQGDPPPERRLSERLPADEASPVGRAHGRRGDALPLVPRDDRPGAPRGRARAGGCPALRMTPRAPHVRSGAGSHLVSGRLTQARLARRTRCGFAPPPIAPAPEER